MSTSVIVPSYSYTVIKIGFLKQLIMDETTLKKMEEINDIKEFVEFLGLYYPGMSINNYTIEEIERALFHTYIKIIGRVMYYSPLNMRTFLKNYLMKYEIMNIQRLILGTVLGMNASEKASLVNKLVERYLGNIEFTRGEFEKAVTSYEKALSFRPNWPEARMNLDIAKKRTHLP